MRRSLTIASVVALHVLFCSVGSESRSEEVSFARHIQPIFAEHCFQCHGPDPEQRQADLRLDLEASAKENAIVPNNAQESELIKRVLSQDPDLRMPPGKAESLSQKQIDLLEKWVSAGAKYEAHWAFQPIADEIPPAVDQSLTDIDKFVVAKLEASNLQLSQPATKQQLIRRATFDLTGLPPTWEEVCDFLNDASPIAFERVIDRLLDSSAYGERWGRHWLDIARYADTHGGAAIGFTRFPFSYTYRDYVIEAFNNDVPYDRFVTEQLAADQLGLPENAKQHAAIGFLTVGMQFRNPHDTIDDQIDVVTRGLMGLTVSCARCHDHKFDAISTKDYYSLYATFASSEVPDSLPLIGEPQSSNERQKYLAELERRQVSYEDMARDQSEVMRGRLRMQVGLYLREIAKGAPEQDISTTNIFSYRTDDLRPLVLQRWQHYIRRMSKDDAVFGPWVRLAKHGKDLKSDAFANLCRQLVGELKAENGKRVKDLHRLGANAPKWNPRVLEALAAKNPKSMLEVADAYGELFAEVQVEWSRALLETSLEAVPGKRPVPDENPKHVVVNSPVNRQLRRHLFAPGTPTRIDDAIASRLLNRPINDNVSGRKGAIHDLNLNSPGSPPRAMIMREMKAPPVFHVFKRGNPINRGEPVSPRFLTALGGSDSRSFRDGERRLSLARSIVDPANPLTRRAAVNWVWQRHFGKGLVRTPDDFGTRGERPTHPRLLDFLASRLLDDGWSLKKLHRRIMLSKVYQQASLERPASRNADPENRLLWRMPRKRLELEAMRDAMLVASGELKPAMGGRPFQLLSNPTVPRRSVYAFVNRDIVAPILSTFDAANPNACTAKRPETTVPQQTLFALNSDFIQDRAAAMAKSVVESTREATKSHQGADTVRALYRRAFSREPDEHELSTAVAYVQAIAKDADKDDDPKMRLKVSLAPWQRLAHVLLAANEFVFVD